MSTSLPVDSLLPDLRRALRDAGAVVLQAPPGAGKTTRVPPALLDEPWLQGRRILMLEPRRLAATNAARYMASRQGEEVGKTVGYTIRFDRKVTAQTRIEVVTEGILTRRLQSDPLLEDVGLIIFDEFHERNLHSDLALALCRDAQMGLRDDLKILVMSATLDAGPVAGLLGGAPLLTSEGRSYPVDVRYLPRTPQGAVADYTVAAVRRALSETAGDVLVFLPGAREIRRCQQRLQADGSLAAVEICPLYAGLPFAAQEKAILPGKGRRVVLATNIAETSLTIEGVRVVVDSGLERRPRFDAAAGLSRLDTVNISVASATQRAGRAGRLAPGICYRLWTEASHNSLLPFAPPEIRVADLSGLALELALWGVPDPGQLAWLDPPPAGALKAARELLVELGALDDKGRVTEEGRRLARFPVEVRLARLLLTGEKLGVWPLACDLAALLSERDLLASTPGAAMASDSDLLDRLEVLARWREHPHAEDTERRGVAAVERTARQLRRLGPQQDRVEAPDLETVGRLLIAAFPDRIACERQEGSGRYLLANGQGVRLSPRSRVHGQRWLVAVEVTSGNQGEGEIHLASALPGEIIEADFRARLPWQRRVEWDARQQRVQAVEEQRLGALVLGSRPIKASEEEMAGAVLAGVRQLGLECLSWSDADRQLAARVRLLARVFPEENWPAMDEESLLESLESWLAPWLGRVRTRAELARVDVGAALAGLLDWPRRQRLEQLAPTHLLVPSGSRLAIDYVAGDQPVLAVKLQELFGLAETPRLAGKRVPLLLHLLSPARRPIQVTTDLKNFWDSVYPEVKKELKGRYPKHPWPDDPWTAAPTRHTRRR
ncbi:ATP-dependent helicase HrpB [Desulfuromonas sp. AOP6]|uniref:ATP-dependent helicase HrpB n=1 Tax=Desulfuromonas sp. AOP6 TaxID=1566351 RepID=UPI00127618A6|nr:ATP-dependent helicase HrpB [Desulfuromonas sp. AOP6]BCA79318.1 ATP-dependent helicase HrpB [Desulfuromonas sp. AOP6]